MAEIWKSQGIEVYLAWCRALLVDDEDLITPLSTWETGFANDIFHQLLNKYDLTEAQAKKLEDIYARKTR